MEKFSRVFKDLTKPVWIFYGDRDSLLQTISDDDLPGVGNDLQQLVPIQLPPSSNSIMKMLEETAFGIIIRFNKLTGILSVSRLCKCRVFVKTFSMDNEKLDRTTHRYPAFSFVDFVEAIRKDPYNCHIDDVKLTMGYNPKKHEEKSKKFTILIQSTIRSKIKDVVLEIHKKHVDSEPSFNSESLEIDKKLQRLKI